VGGRHGIGWQTAAFVGVLGFMGVWWLAAVRYDNPFLMPTPWQTSLALWEAVRDPWVWENLGLTMRRVGTGFGYAVCIGVPVGFLMGSSLWARRMLDPVIDSLRQVPMMAWVPLTIVWFGLGDGPTVFLIAFVGVFAVILNTIAGVENVPLDLRHAARSMGARRANVIADVVLPGAFPDILTGMRVALGAAWMSVICAEFIATSAGFGYLMVHAQTMMETDRLMALMVLGAIIGFLLDRGLLLLRNTLAGWKAVS